MITIAMPSSKTKIILGIDPGIADTGFGVIKISGSKIEVLGHGSIKTSAGVKKEKRLKTIHQDLATVIKKYKPQVAGVEKLFFAKNAKTAMTVGEARGVILLTLAEYNLPIFEFTPMQVKTALTGYGKADKKQMQEMVRSVLKLKNIPKPDDAADALAVALCCVQSK